MGRRVVIVAGLWFAFWMILAASVGGLLADPANRSNEIYFGFFNGAWWALLTSFAWPWIIPTAIDRGCIALSSARFSEPVANRPRPRPAPRAP
jgi:hypothetical protein